MSSQDQIRDQIKQQSSNPNLGNLLMEALNTGNNESVIDLCQQLSAQAGLTVENVDYNPHKKGAMVSTPLGNYIVFTTSNTGMHLDSDGDQYQFGLPSNALYLRN